MKKALTLFLISLLSLSALSKSIVIDGVEYTLNGNGTNGKVSIKVVDKKALPANVIIPPGVVIGDREYPVTTVNAEAFAGCKNLVSIVLPNTVTKIGKFAFNNCTSLKQATMPDEATSEIYIGNYGFGEGGIFKGCTSLQDVRGTTTPYPKYVVYDAIYACEEVPFYQTVEKQGAVKMTRVAHSIPFAEYAVEKVKSPVEQWQKRKEYETFSQWEARVTDANRTKMINEYIAEARNAYLKDNAPVTVFGQLEPYNQDYQFFTVVTPNMGTIYASVPASDKDYFESNWNSVKISPVFGILDGALAIIDCSFELNGKSYPSAQKYEEDDFSQIITNITPLSAIREYEQMMASNQGEGQASKKCFDPDVIDIEIPATDVNNSNTFAVIIGNEDYQRVAPVDYAMNDARIFAKYCNRTLGIPESNIRTYYNSTFGDIVAAMDDIKSISQAYNGDLNVIFYYAGHGVPDESNRNAYLLPIDATGTQPEVCYSLDKLYSQLGELDAHSVVAFIDACFSGSLRGDGMLASARGIKLRPRDVSASGNLVVMSAASADQSAFPYPEKNHGLFTYYLLKRLNDTKGNIAIGDLADYIVSEVSRQSIVENKKSQKPTVKWSNAMNDTWRNVKLIK